MRNKKTFAREDSSHLSKFLEARGMNHTDFAKQAGVSQSAVSTWIRSGEMPKWVMLAINNIPVTTAEDFTPTKDKPKQNETNESILMVRGNSDDIAIISMLSERLNLKVSSL